MLTLTDWMVGFAGDVAYTAPENISARLGGRVYGHPNHKDGTLVTTSPIVSAEGRRITTASGSVYLLVGDPDSAWASWVAEQGVTIDPNNPISFKENK